MGDADDFPTALDTSPSRSVFSELVSSALEQMGTRVRPLTRTYLVELLDRQIRVSPEAGDDGIASLAEDLVTARAQAGLSRIPRLRDLGDRALFMAGFFHGTRSPLVYEQVGRTAYSEISERLASRIEEPSWPGLFRELAERFEEFEALLAEVGDYTRPDPSTELLKIYDRYQHTGSIRDRAELLNRGLLPPPRSLKRMPC